MLSSHPASRDWGRLAMGWFAAASTRTAMLSIGPLLPLIVRDTGLSPTGAGVLTSLPTLLIGLLSLPAGVLADRIGPARGLALAVLAVAVFGAARAFTVDGTVLFGATVALGAAIALAQPAIADAAREIRGFTPAAASAIISNGYPLGALLAFAITVPLMVQLLGADWRTALIAWGMLTLVPAAGWALLAFSDRHQTAPYLRRLSWAIGDLLRIPGLPRITWLYLGQGVVYYGVAAWLPTFFVEHGWSLADAALPLQARQIGSAMMATATPALAARFGIRFVLTIAAVSGLIGLTGLTLIPGNQPYLLVVLVGFGTAAPFVIGLAAPSVLAPSGRAGATAGAVFAVGHVGSVIGPFALGALRDFTGEFTPGMLVLVVVQMTMVVASIQSPLRLRGPTA